MIFTYWIDGETLTDITCERRSADFFGLDSDVKVTALFEHYDILVSW